MTTKRNDRRAPEAIVVTSIRLTSDQHESLKVLAASQHRTVSQELRVAIDHHLASEMKEAA